MTEDRIAAMRVHVIRIPARAVHSHGSGDVGAIHTVLLELRTEGGRTGWGEAAPWPVFTGTVEAAAAALDIYLRPLVLGRNPVQVGPAMAAADRALAGRPEAKAALETALLDLTGQVTGLPIAELLGGRHRAEIPLSFSVANPDFARDQEDVAALYADGLRIFKLKTGFAEHAFDLMRLERLRALYGDAVRLRVDYNQGLLAADAIRRLRDLEGFDLDFIEQPVRREDRTAMAAIAAALDTPVMADESVFDLREAAAGAAQGLADIYSLKIMKSGGLRAALRVAALAEAAGIGVYGGCMFETAIAHAAGAHLMAAVPTLDLGCEFYMAKYYAEADIAEPTLKIQNGTLQVPTAPGLGVAPAVEMLDKFGANASN